MNNQQLWQAVLGELEITLSKANFTTWFKGTFIVDIKSPEVVIGVPNAFTKSWLEKKYNQEIMGALKKITTSDTFKTLKFQVDSIKNQTLIDDVEKRATPAQEKPKTENIQKSEPLFNTASSQTEPAPAFAIKSNQFGLNPKYTFVNFIIGRGNELATAGAQAVSANPGESYNPLFIYGPAGLGKTHLLQAIGNEVAAKNPNKKILYVTCEKFTNDFINAVQSNKAHTFKDIYRAVDLLMIDDIQFMAGKERTQEEFFHTFNALHQANKQVVMTSDRRPDQIPSLENRLLTRFQWGMIADISQPDLETRKAILKTKAIEKKYNLSEDILDYIANNITSSVRELEGALNRLIAYHQLNNVVLNLDVAQSVLGSLTTNMQKKTLTAKEIINTVSTYYDISIEDIVGKCRSKSMVVPRQIIMFLMRNEMDCSFPTIGNELGGRDHTTAMHACSKVDRDYKANEAVRRQIEQIKEKLYTI